MENKIGLKGDVFFTVYKDGEVVAKYEHKNRVTQLGLELIINSWVNGTSNFITDIGVGVANTYPTGTDAGLVNQTALAPLTSYITTLSPPVGGAIEFRATFPTFPETVKLQECGLFAGSTLFSRSIFPPIDIEAGMYFDINWVISFTSV